MRITNKLSIITSTLALSFMSLTPVHASAPLTEIETSKPKTETFTAPLAVLTYESPAVSTTAAPVLAEPITQPLVAPAAPTTAEPDPAPTPAVAVPVFTVQTSTAAPAPPPPTPVSSGKGATIAAAAYAQLGVSQDCTALATNSLAAVGINYHGWPAGYLSLGSVVSAAEAQAGDLIYYPDGGMGLAHIAVYVGNGQAIHGGWNGGTTALASAFVGSGATFIRV